MSNFGNYENIGEIAQDVINERGQPIRAEFVPPGLSNEEYRQHGFQDLEPGMSVVEPNRANFIEHIDVNGNRRFYRARNHRQDKYDPENILEAQEITDESTVEDQNARLDQMKALRKGGKYRWVYSKTDLLSNTGGAFMYFLNEDFPGSLRRFGIYKKSEWEKLDKIEIFSSCLIHCFKNHPNYERLLMSKASVYTLCSKNVMEAVCDILESNITVYKLCVEKNKIKKNGDFNTCKRPYVYVGKGGKKYENTVEICLMQGHFFIYEKETNYTTKYIKNCIWKYEEENKKKLVAKYGLYSSKLRSIDSFNLVKIMLELRDDYFIPFDTLILREPRKELIDSKIMFEDYELFDTEFDCKKWECVSIAPVEIEEECLEDEDEKEKFNSFLDNVDNQNTKPKIQKDRKVKYCIWHGDIETTTDGEKHEPYLMCCSNNDGTDRQYFYGENCVKKCLKYVVDSFVKKREEEKEESLFLIFKFQNAAYDITFIREHLLYIRSSIEPSSSRVYKLTGVFKSGKKNVTITFVDQLQQITMPLRDYEKAFNLEKGKLENFPYFFFNSKTVKKPTLKLPHSAYPEIIKIFPKEYIRESEDRKFLILRHIQYAIDYCHQDVKTQREGWNIMHAQVEEQLGLDFNKYITISNLSKAYCEKEGCYEDVNRIRGKTALFIRKSVVGGRTMVSLHDKKDSGIRILNETEEDEKQEGFDYDYEDEYIYSEKDEARFVFHADGNYDVTLSLKNNKHDRKLERGGFELEIENNTEFVSPRPKLKPGEKRKRYKLVDENSLYPTAIVRLKGYPKGPAKNISEEDLKSKKFLEYADEFYLKIRILKVGRRLHFPCLSKIGENGNRIWSNDMEGEEIFVDRITLEDLIKYHEIEYECLVGVMFNEGYNLKIGEVVKTLYDLRMKYNKEKNPLQLLYKLILNTIYGKTIQKPKDTKILWRNDKVTNMKKLLRRFGESIQSIESYKGLGKNLLKAKIRVGIIEHWAMPQCGSLVLSESKRIMNEFVVEADEHILYTDTDSAFIEEDEYNRLKETRPELFGENLGQLKEEKHLGGKDVVIVKGMFLAPKVYWIREINEKGEKYDKITMKGIPQSSINYVIRQKFDGSVEKMFYGLIKRKKGVLFDILDGGDKIRMDFSSANMIYNLDVFGRRLGGFK